MSEFVSVDRINALKTGIEAKTGETYSDLTGAVQALADGYGQGGDTDYLAMRLTNTLTEYSNSDITEIIAYGLYNCSFLTTVNLPNVTKINAYAFYNLGITEITDDNFPALVYTGQRAFRSCAALTKFVKPNSDVALGGIVFEECTALKTVDVRSCSYVEGNQRMLFAGCTALEAFIIRRTDAVNTWLTGLMFNASGIESGIGYIYVPSALVDSYKAATGWADWAEQIRAIEDYPEITGG